MAGGASASVSEPMDAIAPGEKQSLPVSVQREREMAALVQRAVEHETQRRIRHLRVEVHGKEVHLVGECATFYIKQKAQHAAMLMHRHGRVVNRIDVD